MDAFRPLVIDNRPVAPVFMDGNPLTDGMQQFAAALMNAGPAAAQIRRQREQDDMAQAWRQKEYDRGMSHDALAAEFQKAQIANMQGDNARQMMSMFGSGVNNAASRGIDAVKAIGGLFGGGRARGNGAGGAGVQADWYIFDAPDGSKLMLNKRTGEIKPAVQTQPEGQPVAEAATGDTGWPGLAVAGGVAAGAGGALAAKKLMGGKAPVAAPSVAPAAAAKPAGALAKLWGGAQAAGRFAAKAAAPVAAATGAGMSIYDATQADNGGDVAANLGGAAGYGGLGAAAMQGAGRLAGVGGLATLPVGMITSTIQQELGGTPDSGAAQIIQAYASGQNQPRLGMWSRGLGILANGDSQFPDQIQQQRVQQIVHAVNTSLPPAQDQAQMAKRQMIIGRIEQAAWADDPTELQTQLSALFPNLASQR